MVQKFDIAHGHSAGDMELSYARTKNISGPIGSRVVVSGGILNGPWGPSHEQSVQSTHTMSASIAWPVIQPVCMNRFLRVNHLDRSYSIRLNGGSVRVRRLHPF